MIKTIFSTILICTIAGSIQAANVDTVTTHSVSMDKLIKAVVVTPDSYNGSDSFPVLYLLHGYGGNYGSWVNDIASTKPLADLHKMIIVCPDGGFSSWYYDSPIDSLCQYETYIYKELVEYIDKKYKTIAKREGRAITGLSMGGHGGLFLGFRHQDVFGACGSMSGGVDIRPFPNNWHISTRLGEQITHSENWEKNTVINLTHLLTPNSTKIIIDCGTEDFFFKVNKELHEKLIYMNIPHDFITRPGTHNRQYWDNAVKYQALFFSTYFSN